MRIGLTYNLKPAGASGDQYEEFDSEETIEALERALRASGHEPVRLGWGDEMLAALDRQPVDGVFNIAEGVGGRGRESQVPAVLELLGIPCSGSDALAIGLTLDKALAKLVAKAHGIPTAPWGDDARRYPLFVKPAREGSSMGITAKSLCRDESELRESVARLGKYGPVLIEEFLPGEEYTVGIIGGEVVGTMQVVPRQTSEEFIYSLDVKRDYLQRVDYRLAEAPDVERVALDVWRALNLRGVARVDIRRDRDGIPNFVEVNPLPGVHPVTSDLVILARLKGIAYEELMSRIIHSSTGQWSSCHPERERGAWLGGRRAPRAARPLADARGDTTAVAYNDDAHLKTHLNDMELVGEEEVAGCATEVADLTGGVLLPVRDAIPFDDLCTFDVVVNLCEGLFGDPRLEMHFALALEMLGIPQTGGDPIATGICGDKALTKRLLRAAGLPSPEGFEVTALTSESDARKQLSALRFPTIVKPSREDAGVGIDAASVARTADEVIERCRHIHKTYRQPALIEEFIDGAELNQALFHGPDGLVMLPPGEVVFAETLAPHERIVGWKAKWAYGSAEDRATVNRTPARIADELRDEIASTCRRAIELLGIDGYCRFDLRRDANGKLFIIDVNPNPDIGAGTGFRKALEAAGISFRDFLNATIMAAKKRRR